MIIKGDKSHITDAWKARVRALICRDLSAKIIGLEMQMGASTACRWIYALGFRSMYVTDVERRQVMESRAAKKEGA